MKEEYTMVDNACAVKNMRKAYNSLEMAFNEPLTTNLLKDLVTIMGELRDIMSNY